MSSWRLGYGGSYQTVRRVWVEVSHSVAHGGLQRGVLFGLAADVVEGKEKMVVVCEVGGNFQLHLLVELRRPERGGARVKYSA